MPQQNGQTNNISGIYNIIYTGDSLKLKGLNKTSNSRASSRKQVGVIQPTSDRQMLDRQPYLTEDKFMVKSGLNNNSPTN